MMFGRANVQTPSRWRGRSGGDLVCFSARAFRHTASGLALARSPDPGHITRTVAALEVFQVGLCLMVGVALRGRQFRPRDGSHAGRLRSDVLVMLVQKQVFSGSGRAATLPIGPSAVSSCCLSFGDEIFFWRVRLTVSLRCVADFVGLRRQITACAPVAMSS